MTAVALASEIVGSWPASTKDSRCDMILDTGERYKVTTVVILHDNAGVFRIGRIAAPGSPL